MFGIGRKRYYQAPGGPVYTLFNDMAAQPHLLVAGATGSGKSVVVNGIIYNLMHRCPSAAGLILIDPKRTELRQYASIPHTLMYADRITQDDRTGTGKTCIDALQYAKQLTENRFATMQKNGWREWQSGDVYVIIDELAALMTTNRKAVQPILQYLGIIARAAHVHLICCTQTVKADVLPTTITCNFDSRVALRTSTAQQSRMLVDTNGCEKFPSPVIEHKAYCYFKVGADLTMYNVPKYPEHEVENLVNYWETDRCMVSA